MPHYNFENFKMACAANITDVVILNPVPETARADFNLNTKPQLLSFIANDGLEELKFIHTKEWEKNPDPSNPVMVDSYEFQSLHKLGYIAFMYNRKTKKWLIKSFKLSTNSNLDFAYALNRALIKKKEVENDN